MSTILNANLTHVVRVPQVIVIIIYAGLLAVMLVALYTYFLNIHGAGRILDLHRRLSCKEGTLFIPLDMELR